MLRIAAFASSVVASTRNASSPAQKDPSAGRSTCIQNLGSVVSINTIRASARVLAGASQPSAKLLDGAEARSAPDLRRHPTSSKYSNAIVTASHLRTAARAAQRFERGFDAGLSLQIAPWHPLPFDGSVLRPWPWARTAKKSHLPTRTFYGGSPVAHPTKRRTSRRRRSRLRTFRVQPDLRRHHDGSASAFDT